MISKYLEGIIRKSYKAKKQTPDQVLVEVNYKQQAMKLLAQTRKGDLYIRVTPHRSLNSSQGAIFESDLLNKTDAGLLEGLKDRGVMAVQRINILRDDKEIPTKHVFLTINRSKLPELINAGFIGYAVHHYIPNPHRCFKCQGFGHGTNSCGGTTTCAKCAAQDHPSDNGKSATLTGANCGGAHAA